jgi:HlyD family secretion protein
MTKKKMTLIGGAAIAAVTAIAAIGFRGEPAPAAEVEADIATVERRDLEIRAEAAGRIEPILVIEVKSKASGEIMRLLANTGDYIEQGTVLAEIDPRDVQNSLDQAEADLQVAEVQARTTGAQRQRVEELRLANAMTQQEYESAIQSEASAQASLVRARTNLQLARMRREDVRIAAPITGTVIERTVEAGQIISSATSNVSGGTTLLKMADLSEMQVRTLVDETDIGRVAALQDADVSVDAYPGRIFAGRVLKIEPQAVVEQNVTMFPVLIQLDNREGLLRPGMNAEVVIHISRRQDVIAIPTGAVVAPADAASATSLMAATQQLVEPTPSVSPAGESGEYDGQPAVVFVKGPAGVEARHVVLGLSDWDYTEIIDGLQPGERVMLISVARMREQQQRSIPTPFGGGRGNGAPAARSGG